MKALGARLKLVYTHDDLYFRIGGYAYYNHYVDSSDSIADPADAGLTVVPVQRRFRTSRRSTNAAYDEMIVTGDLDVRVGRLRLLAEFARQSVIYDVPDAGAHSPISSSRESLRT